MKSPYLPARYEKFTTAQIRQQELSWLLYITSGLEANIAAARVRNFTTLSEQDDFVLMELNDALNNAMESIRTLLQEIPKNAEDQA